MEPAHAHRDFRYMTSPYYQTAKQEHERQETVRSELGRQLRARYEAIMSEPLPDRIAALVERLDDGLK